MKYFLCFQGRILVEGTNSGQKCGRVSDGYWYEVIQYFLAKTNGDGGVGVESISKTFKQIPLYVSTSYSMSGEGI